MRLLLLILILVHMTTIFMLLFTLLCKPIDPLLSDLSMRILLFANLSFKRLEFLRSSPRSRSKMFWIGQSRKDVPFWIFIHNRHHMRLGRTMMKRQILLRFTGLEQGRFRRYIHAIFTILIGSSPTKWRRQCIVGSI